jgi:hypothetical protein
MDGFGMRANLKVSLLLSAAMAEVKAASFDDSLPVKSGRANDGC